MSKESIQLLLFLYALKLNQQDCREMSEIRVTAELNLANGIFYVKEKYRIEKNVFISLLDYVKDKLIRLKNSISVYI